MVRDKVVSKICKNPKRGNGHGKLLIYTLICIQNIDVDMVVSKIVQKCISLEIAGILIAEMVMENR